MTPYQIILWASKLAATGVNEPYVLAARAIIDQQPAGEGGLPTAGEVPAPSGEPRRTIEGLDQ